MRKSVALALAASSFAAASPGEAALVIADFSGGVFFPSVGNPFQGISSCCGTNSQVQGSIVYDDEAPIGPGFFNLTVPVSASDGFSISIGSQLTFDLSDLQQGAVAALQFNNGSFVGIVFTADYEVNGQAYQFSSQGGTWSIINPTTFQTFASGFYNASLDNIRPYAVDPGPAPIPEPATWAMLISGFGLAGAALRRRRVRVSYA